MKRNGEVCCNVCSKSNPVLLIRRLNFWSQQPLVGMDSCTNNHDRLHSFNCFLISPADKVNKEKQKLREGACQVNDSMVLCIVLIKSLHVENVGEK